MKLVTLPGALFDYFTALSLGHYLTTLVIIGKTKIVHIPEDTSGVIVMLLMV